MPDSLDHLAREDRVVESFRGRSRSRSGGAPRERGRARRRRRPRAVAVVAEQEPDFPFRLKPPRADSLPGLLELLLRQRQPRPRVQEGEPLEGPERERAPAAPDLEHVVARPQPGRIEQSVEFRQLGVLQGPAGGVQRRGIGHRLVEEEAVHVVSCVVVGLDVLARAWESFLFFEEEKKMSLPLPLSSSFEKKKKKLKKKSHRHGCWPWPRAPPRAACPRGRSAAPGPRAAPPPVRRCRPG